MSDTTSPGQLAVAITFAELEATAASVCIGLQILRRGFPLDSAERQEVSKLAEQAAYLRGAFGGFLAEVRSGPGAIPVIRIDAVPNPGSAH